MSISSVPSDSGAVSSASKQATCGSDTESIFPLRLSPIEQFLVMDDRPECPMTSFIELHFASPLQVNCLADALHQTVHQHPLLASRLVTIDGQLHWQYDRDFIPKLHDPSEDPILAVLPNAKPASGQPAPQAIDLTTQPGCRYWYHENADNDRSRLTIQLHHAACDGVGLRRVLIDTLSAYAKMTCADTSADESSIEGETVELESRVGESGVSGTKVVETGRQTRRRLRDQLNVKRLLDRADFSEIKSKATKESIGGWEKIRNAFYFHFQRPQPLVGNAATSKGPTTDSTDEPLRHYIFEETVSRRLMEVCRRQDIALNDLALAVLFRVCCHWNRLQGITRTSTRIRLLMPIDLRGRSDLQTPATNRLSFSFLGRTHSQCEDWASLLTSVQDETQRIKYTRVYLDFLDGLAALHAKPKTLRRALNLSRNMSTCVLTYTGDIARGMKSHFPEESGRRQIGDSYLENILVAPPARQNTNITIGMCVNWGQICVSANWNRSEITSSQCQQFLQMYADAMVEWLATMEAETIR